MSSHPKLKRNLLLVALGFAFVIPVAMAESFSFGVMSDTQWKADLDGENPGTVAVGIINQLNEQFIEAKVDFVIQVGDLVDKEGTDAINMEVRAAAAQPLYDAGIGFYPLRGNHEGSSVAAVKFQTLFPQTQGLGDNALEGTSNFASPATMPGLTYAFDYKDTTFLLLDQFNRPDGVAQSVFGADQVAWVSAVLSNKPSDYNAFVFAHKGLITENHDDTLFGDDPSAAPDLQNQFMSSLAYNDVRYYFGGHDHIHNRAIITSPDQLSQVMDITTSSNSYKFYTPVVPSNDEVFNLPAFGFLREMPVAQELYTVGYYIVTVDGPRVSVDHFASLNGCGGDWGSTVDCDLTVTPDLSFVKRDTFGYSLNGEQFLIAQGDSYTVVMDEFKGTTARILDGVNTSTATEYAGRPLTKAVNTGWTAATATRKKEDKETASHILTLWGMAELGSPSTDVYVLSMTYEPTKLKRQTLKKGEFGLATRDDDEWINAVDKNIGGTKKFVLGPWKPSYKLGTYGVDPATKTAWAVINHNADFAVAKFED